eukprot:XP_011615618.1 PREDICTED: glutamine-rich protein 2 [Takifugu rubripes]
MSDDISLYDLLNVSIGTPQVGAVNFSALHALLHAVLKQLDIQQVKIRWRSPAPGDGQPDALVEVTGRQAGPGRCNDEVQPGTEQQEGIEVSSSSGRAADLQMSLLPRVQSCEEDVSKMAEVQAEEASAAEKCCLRVDTLEETVRSLARVVQRCPKAEQLGQCVTWEDMQSALLSENLQQEPLISEAVDPPKNKAFSRNVSALKTTPPRSSSPAASSSAEASGETLILQETTVTAEALDAPADQSDQSEPLQQTTAEQQPPGLDLLGVTGGPERYLEAVEALRDISKLREKFSKLQDRVVELEEGKLDQSQLTRVTELITNKEFQDSSNNLMNQLSQQKSLIENLSSDQEKNMQLVNDVQAAFLHLRAECEKLHQCNRNLQEENREKQTHIQELLKTLEELEEKKADKQMVDREIKAEKSALESKVSHLQLDSEQLSTMLKELLNKVAGQEQDWHRVIARLSAEMDSKLNRIELDSVKKQLENRWKNINEKLQPQEGLESDDAAALRKQLVDRFNCLSCDRPIVKYTHTQHLMRLPSTPGFPAHKPIRPFTVYALEQFRQHYRSERFAGLADYSHMTVSRNCGGSHTVNSASQRRQPAKHCAHAEVDLMVQSEEVDIVGLDGHIYKGRLSAPSVRNTEIRLPTISTKDGLCRTKDKVMHRKPASPPEMAQGAPAQHPHSAKSARCSHSASSSSSRDWPVSALGCTSHTSFTQAAADAEIKTQPDEPPDL